MYTGGKEKVRQESPKHQLKSDMSIAASISSAVSAPVPRLLMEVRCTPFFTRVVLGFVDFINESLFLGLRATRESRVRIFAATSLVGIS